MFTIRFRLILLVSLLSGCGPMLHIPSEVPDQFKSLRDQITVGETTRNEAHELFGVPFISDPTRGIEVHRVASGREAYVWFALYPFWVDTEEVIYYALLVYDEQDTVKAIGQGLFDYRSTDESRVVKVQADSFTFVAIKEGAGKSRKEFLLAPASISRGARYLPPPEKKCAVLYFYPLSKRHWRTYFLDGEEIGTMPLTQFHSPEGRKWRSDPDLTHVFAKLIVDEGEHEVRLTTSWKPKAFRSKFDCKSGDIVYVYPKLELVSSEPWGYLGNKKTKYEGEIVIERQPPEGYEGWKRLLFYSGTWLGGD